MRVQTRAESAMRLDVTRALAQGGVFRLEFGMFDDQCLTLGLQILFHTSPQV